MPIAGISYVQLSHLGDLRRGRGPDSPNMGWRNRSFRAYVDYMGTAAFRQGITELLALADRDPAAIMCAEAVPWRCHRSLVADALLARGVVAQHIYDARRADPHRLTPFARVAGEQITYPPASIE